MDDVSDVQAMVRDACCTGAHGGDTTVARRRQDRPARSAAPPGRRGAPREVPGARRRAVLALLALSEGRGVTVDELLDAVWPSEVPESGRRALHSHVSRVRGHLGPAADRLVREGDGYRLVLRPGELDLVEVRQLAARSQQVAASEAAGLLREALAQWRGTALDEFADVAPLAADARRAGGAAPRPAGPPPRGAAAVRARRCAGPRRRPRRGRRPPPGADPARAGSRAGRRRTLGRGAAGRARAAAPAGRRDRARSLPRRGCARDRDRDRDAGAACRGRPAGGSSPTPVAAGRPAARAGRADAAGRRRATGHPGGPGRRGQDAPHPRSGGRPPRRGHAGGGVRRAGRGRRRFAAPRRARCRPRPAHAPTVTTCSPWPSSASPSARRSSCSTTASTCSTTAAIWPPALVGTCDGLTVLATSREPLGLAGERARPPRSAGRAASWGPTRGGRRGAGDRRVPSPTPSGATARSCSPTPTSRSWPRSCGGSTACRWPWSWPPAGPRASAWATSATAWAGPSTSSRPVGRRRSCVTERCARRSSGRTGCSPPPNSDCCGPSPSSRAGSDSTPPSTSARRSPSRAIPPATWPGWSTPRSWPGSSPRRAAATSCSRRCGPSRSTS